MVWIDCKKAYMVPHRQSQNVQGILRNHKVYQKYDRKLESRTESLRKKRNRGENPESDLPRRCAVTITNFAIAMMSLNPILRKFTDRYKLYK